MKFIQMGILFIWLIVCLYFIPYSLMKRNYKTLKFVTIALMLQNLMCLFAGNTLPGFISQFIILYKEIIFWGTVLLACLEKRKFKKNVIPIIIFICYLVICLFNGNATVYAKLVCFRQLMTPVILVLYGRTLRINEKEKHIYMEFVVKLGVFQAIFGLIERYILGDSFWLTLNISKLFETKGFSKWVMSELPGNYYSADFYHIIGKSIRRLVGIITDPLLTAHFLALCIIIVLFADYERNSVKKYIELILLTLACVLTLSKGAVLIIGIAYVYKIWIQNKTVAIGAVGIVIVGIFKIIQSNLFRTVAIHLAGFTTSASDISLIGGGLGTAGNLASLNGANTSVGESFFGMILGQTGCIGLFLFIWMIYRMGKWVLKIEKGKYEYAIIAYIIAVMIEAIMSESAINFVGSGCAFIMLGFFTSEFKTYQVRDDGKLGMNVLK